MEEYKRITDKEALEVARKLKNGEIDSRDVLSTVIELNVDIRKFLRKIFYKLPHTKNKTVTDPLKADKGDIVIGQKRKEEKC